MFDITIFKSFQLLSSTSNMHFICDLRIKKPVTHSSCCMQFTFDIDNHSGSRLKLLRKVFLMFGLFIVVGFISTICSSYQLDYTILPALPGNCWSRVMFKSCRISCNTGFFVHPKISFSIIIVLVIWRKHYNPYNVWYHYILILSTAYMSPNFFWPPYNRPVNVPFLVYPVYTPTLSSIYPFFPCLQQLGKFSWYFAFYFFFYDLLCPSTKLWNYTCIF